MRVSKQLDFALGNKVTAFFLSHGAKPEIIN
jgi:hypothetical protein